MLHRVNLPTYNDSLKHVIQFQQQYIEFLCDPGTSEKPTEEHFRSHFGDNRGAWLYKRMQLRIKNKKKSLYEVMCEAIAHIKQDSSLGQKIIETFKHDTCFNDHFEDATFVFLFPTNLDTTTHKVLAPLMIAFYEQLFHTGFPACIHGSKEPFDRKLFIKQFRQENEHLGVCPACDDTPPDYTPRKDYSDIDHIFPKSLYPFLSIHAANLVPICLACNERAKSNIDPLDPTSRQPLIDTFHPFKRPAVDEIQVSFTRQKTGQGGISIREKSGLLSGRIARLNNTFNLEERWNGRLRDVIRIIRQNISDAACNPRKKAWSIEDIVKDILETIQCSPNERIGCEPNYFISNSYACFALHSTEEREDLNKVALEKRKEQANLVI